MTVGLTTAQRNARLQVIATALDVGGAGAKLKIYDGARPATGGTATTLLATFTMPYPSPTPSGGVMTFTPPSDVVAVATGTATWARLTTSADAFVADLSVATSGADITINSAAITSGQTLHVSAAGITEGNA